MATRGEVKVGLCKKKNFFAASPAETKPQNLSSRSKRRQISHSVLFVQVVDAGARELGQGHRVVHVQDDRMKFLEV